VTDLATRPGKRLLSMASNLVDRLAFDAGEDIAHALSMAGAETGTRRRPWFSPAQAHGASCSAAGILHPIIAARQPLSDEWQ